MIIVLKQNAEKQQVENLKAWLEEKNLGIHLSEGKSTTIMGLIGDCSTIDIDLIAALEIVETAKRINEPYKKANRKFHPDDTVITLSNGTKIGGGNFVIMAGPCSVESKEQICEVADAVKSSGAKMIRGGAFKPRTSPYAFQGMGSEGLDLLKLAKDQTGLPIISELMDLSQLPLFEHVDIIQIGARNMQNFTLLKEIGKINKPILLKRGLANTIDELLMSAEYIMASGNSQVLLCERGIRTYETATRNTLDLSAVPVLRERTHLPIIVDPTHATGYARYVEPMSLAATACGADGLLIEVHNNPAKALCDGPQSLTPEAFDKLMRKVEKIRAAIAE